MCAACGPAANPDAASVNSIVVPVTFTIAVPLPLLPFRITGLRFALADPSAKAVPTDRNGAANGRARARGAN